jgi:hypothetical protein
MKTNDDYYIKKKSKIVKDFEGELDVAAELLESWYNPKEVDEVVDLMKNEFEEMIPNIPYIGGQKNPTTLILLRCVSNLAIFRILEKKGFSFEEIGEFYYKFSIGNHQKRKLLLEKAGRDPAQYPFEKSYLDYQKKLCEDTQKREYSGDWVMDFVNGDGKSFDWGWNIYDCGVQKAYEKFGGLKYLPFICLGDHYEAEALGFGFSRTQTLGFGAPLCDHRFIRNSKTKPAWPPFNLQEFNPNHWNNV